jgi:hypothetical protein
MRSKVTMNKYILTALAIVVLGTATMTQPATARWCGTDGHHWICQSGAGPGWWWRQHHPARHWYPF